MSCTVALCYATAEHAYILRKKVVRFFYVGYNCALHYHQSEEKAEDRQFALTVPFVLSRLLVFSSSQ